MNILQVQRVGFIVILTLIFSCLSLQAQVVDLTKVKDAYAALQSAAKPAHDDMATIGNVAGIISTGVDLPHYMVKVTELLTSEIDVTSAAADAASAVPDIQTTAQDLKKSLDGTNSTLKKRSWSCSSNMISIQLR